MFLEGVFDGRSSRDRSELTPAAEVEEKYIELMCKFEPKRVHTYLRGSENYRLEQTLAVSNTVWRVLMMSWAVWRHFEHDVIIHSGINWGALPQPHDVIDIFTVRMFGTNFTHGMFTSNALVFM